MIVRTDSLMLVISFKHTLPLQKDEKLGLSHEKIAKHRAQTACRIESLIASPMCPKHVYKTGSGCMCQPVNSATEVAICHPRDQFNKEDGRRESLRRALCAIAPGSGESKNIRRAAWIAFFDRPKTRALTATATQHQLRQDQKHVSTQTVSTTSSR